jgi:hypothetical protein
MSQDAHVGFRQDLQGISDHPHAPPLPIFNTAIMSRGHRLETFIPSKRFAIDWGLCVSEPALFPYHNRVDA